MTNLFLGAAKTVATEYITHAYICDAYITAVHT